MLEDIIYKLELLQDFRTELPEGTSFDTSPEQVIDFSDVDISHNRDFYQEDHKVLNTIASELGVELWKHGRSLDFSGGYYARL